MKLQYKGKTKDVYELEDGNYLLQFKDDVTGTNGVFDPGANSVGLTIEGIGKSGLKLTQFFFEKLKSLGIPTHYIHADVDKGTMTVKKATPFGEGLEFICRFRAVGSFIRRYGKYAKEGQELDAFVEVTLKDDERQDPPINQEALLMLNLLSQEEYTTLVALTKQISEVIKDELALKNLELYDIKLEFGRVGKNNEIALIDEISGGNMRAYQNSTYIAPMEIEKIMLK